MNAVAFDIRSLLERAGFTIRSATRADCARCSGRSRGTVSFTPEVAHCFRCGWKENNLTLARELGLLGSNPQARAAFRESAKRRARLGSQIKPFAAWREARIREVSDRYLALSRAALRGSETLGRLPDCEQAWDALALFYHSRAQLSASFDFLVFGKASAWLETDATPAEVFEAWRCRRAA